MKPIVRSKQRCRYLIKVVLISLAMMLQSDIDNVLGKGPFDDGSLSHIPGRVAAYIWSRGHSDPLNPRYGNWYGPGWWGGDTLPDRPGDKPPVNSLDIIAMYHDMAYDEAEKQGNIFGEGEKYYLMAVADYWCMKEVLSLDTDPEKWDFPPENDDHSIKEAREFRDDMIVGFSSYKNINHLKSYYHEYVKEMQEIINSWDRGPDRITLDELKRRRDQKVSLWIRNKERSLEGAIGQLVDKIGSDLSQKSKEIQRLCNSLKENLNRVQFKSAEVMRSVKSSEVSFTSFENIFSCCDKIRSYENIIHDATQNVRHLNGRQKHALANARTLLNTCKSEEDATKVIVEYNNAEESLIKINEQWSRVETIVKDAEKCKIEIDTAKNTASTIMKDINFIISESNNAISLIDNSRNTPKDPILRQKELLNSSCEKRLSSIRHFKWSPKISKTLEREISRYCSQDCDFWKYWDAYKNVESDIRNAKAIAVNLTKMIGDKKKNTNFMNEIFNTIDEIKKDRKEAIDNMTAASNISTEIGACIFLAKINQSDYDPSIRAKNAIKECRFEEAEKYIAEISADQEKTALQRSLYEAKRITAKVNQICQEGKEFYSKGKAEESNRRYDIAKEFYQEAYDKFKLARDLEVCEKRSPSIHDALSNITKKIEELGNKLALNFNIAGTWHGGGNSTYHVTQTKNDISWVGTGFFASRKWHHKANGKISGNTITAEYKDLPGSGFYPNQGKVSGTVSPDERSIIWTGAFNPLEINWKRK